MRPAHLRRHLASRGPIRPRSYSRSLASASPLLRIPTSSHLLPPSYSVLCSRRYSAVATQSTSADTFPGLESLPRKRDGESGYDIKKNEHSSPMQEYRRLIDTGALKPDDHQVRIIQKLQDLHDELVRYNPPPPSARSASSSSSSFLSRLFGTSSAPSTPTERTAPHGLYLYGDVGTGKTMLMDLFFKTLPPNIVRKRRVHFHAFMVDVHKRIHAAKIKLGHAGGDPIDPVARDLARETSVLCFDEFQVTDIADAMILRRLLETLLEEGVVMVITSNRHPDQLYKNGIQRTSFMRAINLLKSEFNVTDLDSGTDYRRIPRSLSNVYYDPLDDPTRSEINKLFAGLTDDAPVVEGRQIDIWGRKLRIPKSAGRVAMFSFEDLCGSPLSAADYIEVTRHFGTVFVTDVKKMGLEAKDKARRFITFVDACYESKTKLIVSSEVPIFHVFSDDSASSDISDHMRSIMDDLGLPPDVIGAAPMFSGEEELFAFARCCSRLVQMGSTEWAETAGL